MTNAIQTHRETVLESPYSRDRKEAIEELVRLFPDVGDREKRRTLETLRQVAFEATSSSEREQAQDALVDAFGQDPEVAASVVVPAFCDLTEDAKHKDERLDALDALRELYPDADETYREQIGQQLAEIAGNATYEDERRRARQRLSDVTAENERGATDEDSEGDSESAVGYLGQSLAEHLANAAEESPEACLRRAEELRNFVAENPKDSENYDELRTDLDDLVEQLELIPTEDRLGTERQNQVKRLASRVSTLYSL